MVVFKVPGRHPFYDVFTGKRWTQWSRVAIKGGIAVVIRGEPLNAQELAEIAKHEQHL